MSVATHLRALATKLLHRSEFSEDMDEELRSHIQLRADDLERRGMMRAEAERRARIEFGGQEKFKEQSYEALGGNFIESLMQDVRFGARVLLKSPGFALAAICTLALAIGANSVVFGVMNALVLRPLNVPRSQSLWGTVYGENPEWQSYPNYIDLRDRNHSFEDLAAFRFAFVGLDTGNNPAVTSGFAASGNYFDVLGIQPYLGRFFHASDEHGPNSAPYLVLSYPYWHTHFHDDRNVIGRTAELNKHTFTIIGVAPPEFVGTLLFVTPDFFMPLVNQEQIEGLPEMANRGSTNGVFEVLGHLKPGVTRAQAIADLESVDAYLEKTYPKEVKKRNSSLAHPGLTAFNGPARAFVGGLMALTSLILLAACANLGGLFAARAADRGREVALRLALGSSRRRILRQLLTEALLISLAGGMLGLWGSVFVLNRLNAWRPFDGAPIHIPIMLDWKTYIVALGLALVSGFLFGMVPVRQVLRANPYEVVKAGSIARNRRRISARDVMLAVQIAICAVLVTSSIVALRGLMRSLHSNFGIEPKNTLLANTNLVMAGYSSDHFLDTQKRMVHALQAIPGVEQVGLVNDYPPMVYTAGSKTNVFREETTDLRAANAAARPYRYEVSPEYFQAAGTALLAGRSFTWHDDKDAPKVALVNREFASTIFGSVPDAVGRYCKLQDGLRVQVVGVVEDGKYVALTEDRQAAMFLPFLQSPSGSSYLIVRSSRDPQQLSSVMRAALHKVDAGLPVDFDTWTSLMGVAMFPARIATLALGVLGLMGAILSINGIFGMAAYSVSIRMRELGIRMALGGQRWEVLQAALGRAFKLLAFGSLAGLILGVLASRVLAYIVYQATPRDPLVLGGAVLAMALLGFIATWIPAQRALSVNPLILLREE
ncbi:MAG TPA: ABC transporter permease [Candidatus Sulfotelmatobacter sp.]